MQNYIKSGTDTRTFQQIWETLTPAERSEVRGEVMSKIRCSRQAVYTWTKGSYPVNRLLRVEVAKVVNKTLGLNTHHLTLFPNAK